MNFAGCLLSSRLTLFHNDYIHELTPLPSGFWVGSTNGEPQETGEREEGRGGESIPLTRELPGTG